MDVLGKMYIPFTESLVTDWRFFNREDTMNSVYEWVMSSGGDRPSMSPVLLLHGQRRIGKSSLVSKIIEEGKLSESSNRKVVPVLVDFRLVSLDRPESVAELIIQKISATVGMTFPKPDPCLDPFAWFESVLFDVSRMSHNSRLIIIIDEFDAELTQPLDPLVRRLATLTDLRAIISGNPEIRWLLIVQDASLADPTIQSALIDFPFEVHQLSIEHLSRYYARQLIIDLTTFSGVGYESMKSGQDDLPDQIINWTCGNPYFIHVICRRLILRAARHRRKLILQEDLYYTLRQVLGRPVLFSHFTEHLEHHYPRRLIATYLASAVPPGKRLLQTTIQTELVDRTGLLNLEDIMTNISFLEKVGVFDQVFDRDGQTISIPIRLLHKWILENWPYISFSK